MIDDSTNAIAGRFLVIGEDAEGTPLDVTEDVTPILARFTCQRCLFEAEFVTRTGDTEHGVFVQTRLHGVQPRIDKKRPTLIEPKS